MATMKGQIRHHFGELVHGHLAGYSSLSNCQGQSEKGAHYCGLCRSAFNGDVKCTSDSIEIEFSRQRLRGMER